MTIGKALLDVCRRLDIEPPKRSDDLILFAAWIGLAYLAAQTKKPRGRPKGTVGASENDKIASRMIRIMYERYPSARRSTIRSKAIKWLESHGHFSRGDRRTNAKRIARLMAAEDEARREKDRKLARLLLYGQPKTGH
jgi:hypothetical protein